MHVIPESARWPQELIYLDANDDLIFSNEYQSGPYTIIYKLLLNIARSLRMVRNW